MIFQGDMARRVIPLDLDSKMERPEERSDFRHAPLLGWVLESRPRLVVDALTILCAYVHAGRPSQGITPLGSFEEWSRLVRQALIWAGEADPCTGRQSLEAESDPQFEQLSTLLQAWYACYEARATTVKQVLLDIRLYTHDEGIPKWNDLREALGSLDPKYAGRGLNSRVIGDTLRTYKGRMINGKRFVISKMDRTNVAEWKIEVHE